MRSLSIFVNQYLKSSTNKIIFGLTILVSFVLAVFQSVFIPKILVSFIKQTKNLWPITGVLLVAFLLFYLKSMLEKHFYINLRQTTREYLFRCVINKYSENYKDIDIGTHITRVFEGTRHFQRVLESLTIFILPFLFSTLSISIATMYMNFNIGLPLFVGFLMTCVLIGVFGTLLYFSKQKEEQCYCALNNNLNTTFKNLMNTYINNEDNNTKQKISNEQKTLTTFAMKAQWMMILLSSSIYLNTIIWLLVAIYMHFKVQTDNASILIMFLILYGTLSFNAAPELAHLFASLGICSGIAPYLNKLENYNSNYTNSKITSGSVEVNNLSFHYKGKQNLFENFNLSIRDGEKVAIVGHSGRGKSTLAHLLLKMHSNYKGSIKIGNVNIKHISPTHLRDNVVYINQRTTLIDGSVIDNMRFGSGETSTDELVRQKLSKYKLNTVFSKLTDGLNEEIVESGANISLGMQKIILLIRGILKCKNARVVIIDEPLAALDPKTRSKVLHMLETECAHKTVIIITHDMEIQSIVDKTIHL